jgi:hypothetical protein
MWRLIDNELRTIGSYFEKFLKAIHLPIALLLFTSYLVLVNYK